MKSPKDKMFESQDNGAAGQGMSSEALEYLKKAQRGDPEAQCNLGWCYENGKGVKQDWQKAVEWFTKAAQQGDEYAKEALKRLR